jgi:hypothetical protein
MGKDHRIIQADGERLDFTCQNMRYKTNISRGFAHAPNPIQGSVLSEPLSERDGNSLWLEHVVRTDDPEEDCYWLMWYKNGHPAIPMSGILDKQDIQNMQRLLAAFIP